MALRFLPLEDNADARCIRAAAYVRMSTDMQVHSIANQLQMIEEYAERNSISIVQTYADLGRSGLTLERRPGLQALLQDVQSRPDFHVVLVHDVSRWGRFQDVDESAYYEFLCRKAGVKVVYCAEPFEADRSPMSSVFKTLKRVMAAEYSRELSRKVFLAQCRIVSLGFHSGGPAPYGLNRVLVDEKGSARLTLSSGERKSLKTDRVILAPGTTQEVAVVRKIFRLYVEERLTKVEISRRLNSSGSSPGNGRLWSASKIARILANERYVGISVFNKTTSPLGGKSRPNPRERWVMKPDAYGSVLNQNLFKRAQRRSRAVSGEMTKAEILAAMKRLVDKHGKISGSIINAAEDLPSRSMIYKYFGPLTLLYPLIGFTPRRDLSNVMAGDSQLQRARAAKKPRKTPEQIAEIKRGMLEALAALLKREGRLSSNLISNEPLMASATQYHKYFGSLFTAYELVGYSRSRPT